MHLFYKTFVLSAGLLVLAACSDPEAYRDPIKVSPDIYTVLGENDNVRVLEASLAPGQETEAHSHHESVVYVLEGGVLSVSMPKPTISDPSETPDILYLETNSAFFRDPVALHTVENIGDTDVNWLIFELKAPVFERDFDLFDHEDSESIDAVYITPDVYDVLFEDDDMRVLHGHLVPGASEDSMHSHPEMVVYLLAGDELTLHTPEGLTTIELTPGSVSFYDAVDRHYAENSADTVVAWIVIEFKNRK